MALWVEEQLLAMRDFEVSFYISRSQRNGENVEALNESLAQKYIEAAKSLYGVRLDIDHIAKAETPEGDKMYKWTYAWQPNTGDAYVPQYAREFTLKTLTYSLPKGIVKLRVRDHLERTMQDDSRRERFFELSSWDDTENRWIYREVVHQ